MKNCELVEDLLPFYFENMLGETATEFVKEHMEHCPGCKRLCERLSHTEKAVLEENLPPTEKENSVRKIVKGYRKWFYTMISIAVIFSLLGGILGTYIIMKYEEFIPNHIAQDFVKYGLHGDRWVYQERMSRALKDQVPFEKYSKQVEPSGFKVYKNVIAQEYGPFDVSLKVGLVLEKDGFKVFKISINDRADYLKKKAALEKALDNKNGGTVTDIDKQYFNLPPADPTKNEYLVEGRILKITDNKIELEQHMDTHSVPVDSFTITKDTAITRHHVFKDGDYYRKIQLKDLKVGDVIFVIFTKEHVPRAVSIIN